MDTIDDISSTCENVSGPQQDKSRLTCIGKDNYECDTETEYDSENETIDVICENSVNPVIRISDKNNSCNSFTSSDRGFFENRVIFPTKSLGNTRNICDSGLSANISRDSNSVIHSRSKTFLIDNILGNDRNDTSQINHGTSQDIDHFEETGDEHNGKCKLVLTLKIIV